MLQRWCMVGMMVPAMVVTAPAAASERTEVQLAEGWRFHQGAVPGDATATAYDDSGWDRVAVPHTWNRVGNYAVTRRPDANTTRGVGWYRLRFTAPAATKGKRVYLQFDAASIVADIWVNRRKLGRHEGAFSRFRIDATDAIRAGENILVVKVDNSKPGPGSPTEFVVPISGDFFMYGGLYRPVSLITTGQAHIDLLDHGGPGVYGRIAALDDGSARVAVRTRLRNDGRSGAMTLRTTILDNDGRTVARDEQRLRLAAGANVEREAMLTIARPRRWNGTADPYLYRMVVELVGQGASDRVEQPLGLRTVAVDPNRGFLLNGKPLPLRGVNRHQDRQEKGWALTTADHAQDMALIEELGANSVRLAHYNHATPFYDLADRNGMVLWAELGLVNLASIPGVADTPPAMKASAEAQMVELIRQNYNHPSVGVWSIGNEITNWASKGLTPSNARPLMNALDVVAKREDPSRPTTIAACCEVLPGEKDDGRDRTAGTADTVAYNLYYGWYVSGRVSDASKLGAVMRGYHRENPTLPVGVGEYGAGGAITQHTDNVHGGKIESIYRPQAEEIQAVVHELSWKELKPLDFLWGTWVWQMFDATSDLREEGDSTDINTKGLVTFDRTVRKDAYWFYKAAWSTKPVLHLTGRRYVDRAYPVVDIRAYANAPEAMLTVNGRSIGRAACADYVCVWPKVRLGAGDNAVVATAAGQSDRMTLRYTGPQRAIHVRTGTLEGVTLGNGTRYGSDDFFDGGLGFTLNPYQRELYAADQTRKPGKVVAGAGEPRLYASWRAGKAFRYALPLPDGRYRVTLHLFDPTETAAGKRVFTVVASGGATQRIDVVARAGGGLRATTVDLPATATGGMLTLDFAGVVGDAVVSAIDVVAR
ncbi:glycoside hydrolase family 2 TIM barrel-domain containing protein [Sphingomonas sp. CFBP 13720]|uniref:glycoside hydrolase family 2 TIM barrel-domain containing protein n=1 Tax=Sphingomonas sp. CFBP 13720 TaxID=2775302 RepID=UPI0017857E6B|nr:glycoside hydrolase family 2 TIM barrel-domain containing protein [Sphingomonas sp. CFBP 13720]MBD8679511.1 beta galactosidase jelly roll domain-containing protein [Sphingomonas sp. CFBP 13720]